MNMKYLHIMTNSKFSEDISQFYNQLYSDGSHEILFLNDKNNYGKIKYELSIPYREMYYNNSIDYLSMKKMVKYIKKYDRIVLHSIFIPYLLQLLICLNKQILQSIIWIESGFDLYGFSNKDQKSNLRKSIEQWIDKKIRIECNSVVCIFPPDMDYYRSQFPDSKAKVFYAPYCGPYIGKEYQAYSDYSHLKEQVKINSCITIQIGHNALASLNHIEVLKDLSRFKDKKDDYEMGSM